jgi:glutaconate CoA-transferase subunit A
MGAPFVPVRGLYGSDLMQAGGGFKVIDDPFEPGEQIVVAPALRPDLFITHGALADREGNVITVDEGRNDLLAAQASRRALLSVEEISTERLSPATKPGWIFIPAVYVTAVALAPGGSLPAGFSGVYPADEARLREYAEAGRSDQEFKDWLGRRVWLPAPVEVPTSRPP